MDLVGYQYRNDRRNPPQMAKVWCEIVRYYPNLDLLHFNNLKWKRL